MEKQQLSVDDDLLPIYYVSSDIGPGTFSRVWQEHEVSSSASHLNLLPPLDHGGLASAPPSTERSRFYIHCRKDQEGTKEVGFISGTNGGNYCADKDYSRVQKEIFPNLHPSSLPKATNTKTQVNPMAKSTSAQDVILASLLQVQLCVLDLQDQIDNSETCRLRAKEPQSETDPPYVEFDDAVRENQHQEREEDQESDDTFYSEVEDERLFCDNPLFNSSKPSHPVGHSIQPSVPALGNEGGLGTSHRIETQGNELLLAQNVWDSNGTGTRKAVWHQIAREESLEELQIYEDEWEKKMALSASSRTRKWHLTDSQQYTQEVFVCAEDAPCNVTGCTSAPEAPEFSPCQEATFEEEGLLFSEPGLWTTLLLADEESEHKPLPSMDHSSTSQMQEEPSEESLLTLCHDQFIPIENHEVGTHLLCQGCQGKEHVSRRLPLESMNEELRMTTQQDSPEIVIDQWDGRMEELRMTSQQDSPEIVIDQWDGRNVELRMTSQQDSPEIVIDQWESRNVELRMTSQQDSPEIVIDQWDGRNEELRMTSQQESPEIVIDQWEGRNVELRMTSQQDIPKIVIDQWAGRNVELRMTSQQDFPKIVIDQWAGRNVELRMTSQQDFPKIVLDQWAGRNVELRMTSQQDSPEIVLDQWECRTDELRMTSQQDSPEIVLDQWECRTDELRMTSQQDIPEIVMDQLDDVSTDFETSGSEEVTYVDTVAITQDAEAARCLAVKLFHLDGFKRSQVAAYLQKNNDFSTMVAEEYLALFDFTGKSLDVALRSLLQELVLTGETQERERVLFHFSKRFHSCNPKEFSSADAVHTLTCAIMLLNSDLHGQNIGKSMTTQEFINNLDGMNDGGNFPRELLKGLHQAIRVEKLEWAVSEEKLGNVLVSRPENLLSIRKKSSPFLDIPAPDPQAPIYKQGTLCRKVHAYIDGKKTPWGKRGWKSFHTVLKGMLLFFLKDEYRCDFQYPEEVISVHHALAEKAIEYTKRPHVFRLQTADWRVFLFQAQTSEEMNSWISRINLVTAMFSSPPFPAAVGSQKRFYRPILPTSQCKLDLEEQLQSHECLMDSFTDDLTEHQRNLPDSKSKTRDWEDYHLREEYLRYEKMRYETYVKILALRMESGCEDLHTFESRLTEADGGQEEGSGLKRSYSSPSLNPENFPVAVKVKRNISERRTYRRIIPKRNKNLV